MLRVFLGQGCHPLEKLEIDSRLASKEVIGILREASGLGGSNAEEKILHSSPRELLTIVGHLPKSLQGHSRKNGLKAQ